jgi:hypothetical protein
MKGSIFWDVTPFSMNTTPSYSGAKSMPSNKKNHDEDS